MTSMPSSTLVTQAASRRFDPFTSTRHRRHAPTVESPSNSQSRGMKIPF